jgi:hypothetical protein
LSIEVHKWNRKNFNPTICDQVCPVSIFLVTSVYEVEKFVAALEGPETKVLLFCTYNARIVDQEETGCSRMLTKLH